jgi:beta-galactosidase/beta-glucuronidase
MKLILPLAIVAVFGLLLFKPWQQQPTYKGDGTVHIKSENGSFQLYRNGAPYYVKGASIVDMSLLHKVKESGGNSIRLYDTYGAGPVLDSAQKLGLTVTLGLRVRQARMELDYSDKAAVARQYEELKKEVLRYKDHPALLMWAVGNETTLFIPSRYTNFFAIRRTLKAVDDLAAMVHEVDPNHPTTMILASVSEPLIRMTNMVCRNIDLLSFNIFSPLKQYLAKIPYCGWRGPYLVTEFGAKGYWSTGKTDWHSRVEQTSYQKSQYLQAQFSAIKANRQKCLGAYVFVWGTKQEYTPIPAGTIFGH